MGAMLPEMRSAMLGHLTHCSEDELDLYIGVMAEPVTQVKLVCGDLAHRRLAAYINVNIGIGGV